MAATDVDTNIIYVLYVEDDRETRESLSELIAFRYPEVGFLFAGDGREGLELFKKHQPQIVITDINMPKLNGLAMAAEIKSLCPSVEVYVLTAYSNSECLLNAIEIGISHFLRKPIDVEQLFTLIDKSLDKIRSEQIIIRQNAMIQDLNTELVRKAAELELANQELESFNYSVAHDLRSPIVTICGFSQILLDLHTSKLDDTGKGYLEAINKEINRMNRLVAVLLQFAVHSRKRLAKKWADISEIAKEIRDNLLAQEDRRHVTFTIADDVKGYCDPELLRIVLENLLGNAWKYSAMKSPARIEFGTINREEDLVYFVRDNGIGFDPTGDENLFIPFQRLQSEDSIEGFGIGLATVDRIIRRHGGKIWADGEKHKGATFYFTL